MSAAQMRSAPLGGMVVTAHPAASGAGREVLAVGGNAIDAAVAAAWALCVCEPSGSGLGGQTVLLVRYRGKTVVVDGHSHAPNGVSRATVTRAQQRLGHRATTVPTTPATLEYVHACYGVLSASRVLAPAIRLAEEGYAVTPLQHRQLRWCRTLLGGNPAASRFLGRQSPYQTRDTFLQPELAACLRRLASRGTEDFYRGDIARAIERDMRRYGGLLTGTDLAASRPPRESEPIVACYRDRIAMTAPTPGGGPQLLRALSELEQRREETWSEHPESWYQAVAASVHDAFRLREQAHRPARWAGADGLLVSPAGAERHGETTHVCTADGDGNVVTLTQSIQSLFGAKVANPDYGFLYNNYLLTCPRRRHTHRLASGCSVRSNAAPILVLADAADASLLALGAAGSRRIISSLVQVISGRLDLGLTISKALDRPRVHPLLRSGVWLERPAASAELVASLQERYGAVELRRRHSYSMGAVQALEVFSGGEMAGAADPRREGTAARC